MILCQRAHGLTFRKAQTSYVAIILEHLYIFAPHKTISKRNLRTLLVELVSL